MSKVYVIVPIVLTWILKSMADGKISASELLELAETVSGVLGVKLEVDLPGAPKNPTQGV